MCRTCTQHVKALTTGSTCNGGELGHLRTQQRSAKVAQARDPDLCPTCAPPNSAPQVWYRQGGASRKTVYTSCRRVIVSATQSLANMKALFKDLDERERKVFGQVSKDEGLEGIPLL